MANAQQNVNIFTQPTVEPMAAMSAGPWATPNRAVSSAPRALPSRLLGRFHRPGSNMRSEFSSSGQPDSAGEAMKKAVSEDGDLLLQEIEEELRRGFAELELDEKKQQDQQRQSSTRPRHSPTDLIDFGNPAQDAMKKQDVGPGKPFF